MDCSQLVEARSGVCDSGLGPTSVHGLALNSMVLVQHAHIVHDA